MAIAYDSSAKGTTSFNHTCASGAILLVHTIDNFDADTTVTYNSVSMSLLATSPFIDNGFVTRKIRSFYLLNPASGTHTVAVSNNGSFTLTAAVSYTGADTSSQPDVYVSAGQSSGPNDPFTQGVTTTKSGDWVVWQFGNLNNGANISGISNGTIRQESLGSSTHMILADSNGSVSVGSYSNSATQSSWWGGIMVAIKPPQIASSAAVAFF